MTYEELILIYAFIHTNIIPMKKNTIRTPETISGRPSLFFLYSLIIKGIQFACNANMMDCQYYMAVVPQSKTGKWGIFLLIPVLMLLPSAELPAQLSGPKSIPGDYATIALAITDLNAVGVGAGGVTFNVAAGHTETSDVPVLSATGTAANPIIFQKSGAGANPKITPLTAGTILSSATIASHGDGILVINGGDYITFDGIDLQTDPAFSGSGMYEYGYYFKKASGTDACKNVIIRNCSIILNKAAVYSFGIFISNISGTGLAGVTSTGGRSENISLYNNHISNVHGGILIRGYTAAAPYDFYDQHIWVGEEGGNTISDFGGGGTNCFGINAAFQNELKINNNTITGGDNSTVELHGISLGTCTNSNFDINNNTIALTSHSPDKQLSGIKLSAGTGTANTHNVINNTIHNFSRPAATTGMTYFIHTTSNAPLHLNITGNMIGTSSLQGTGVIYGIYQNANSTNTTIADNVISGITRTTNAPNSVFYGINATNGTVSTQTTISGNIIHTLTANGSTPSGAMGGIITGTQTTVNIFKNKIYNLTNDHDQGVVYGMTLGANVATYHVYNNLIGNLYTPSTSLTSDAIRGINITSNSVNSTINLSYNTVCLDAASTGVDFSTTGVFHTTNTTATTATLQMCNTIIVNTSVPNGSGKTIAYRRSSSALNNYGSNSNNNLFYSGVPDGSHLIYWDNSNAYQTLATYQAWVAPRDALSVTENAPFMSTSGSSPDFLHIDPAEPSQIDSGGMVIGGITDDYDGDTRNSSVPDIGADEYGTGGGGCAASVTNADDTGAGSLRDVIACVPDGATITFAQSLMGQTIILTSGEIEINKNITLSGPGMLNLSLSGNNASRIFHLLPGHTLRIEDMALKNASALTQGGALFVEGHLILENVRFQNNQENGVAKSLTIIAPAMIEVIGVVELKE